MEITIKDGKYIISGVLQDPARSKSGKTFIVATSNGFVSAKDEKGKSYSVSLNITTK